MTTFGSHIAAFQEAPACPGCQQPMVCTRSGLFECDCHGGPDTNQWLGLPL